MAKLYPPYINGTIPAFYHSKGTVQITVPFSMNKAVALSEVAGFALKIKTVNGDVKGVVKTSSIVVNSNASVTFPVENIEFIVGQYYKVQLAYIDQAGVIGYYSTVAIVKCTIRPVVKIEGLTHNSQEINSHQYSYTGTYSQFGGDVTEKMYSCQFLLYDSEDNIIIDSGEILHNTTYDSVPYESHEEFLISQDLDVEHSYYIQFIVKTTNNLIVPSAKYRIVQRRSVSADIKAGLIAGRDFNNGYVVLSITDKIDPIISGTFLISRAGSNNDYRWEEIKRFDLHSIPPESWSYRDYTVEQGVTYKYSLQQYNAQGIYSDRIISNTLTMDFEDMFLYDGNRQLRIRYNPKVSSYKTDILESKTDTIGSRFPFFSRNGNVYYKEFAISGLISYLADEAENFVQMTDIGLDGFSNIHTPYGKYGTTNLVDYNIAAERFFKNEVLDWLNDGQVKLFKSPTEGNYLVRLMNVSLSPMDQVSRMLHTFSATAYEVAEFNSENLTYYGLIDPREKLETQTRWMTVKLEDAVNEYLTKNKKTLENSIGDKITLNTRDAVYIDFRDMVPGAHIQLQFENQDAENIQIGVTGAYHFETGNDNVVVPTIQYIIDTINDGQLTYGYLAQSITVFGLIEKIVVCDVPAVQLIGKSYLVDAHTWDKTIHEYVASEDVFDMLNDVRTTVLNVNFMKAEKRPVDTLFINNPGTTLTVDNFEVNNYTYYTDIYCKERFDLSKADPLALYRIRYRADTSPYDVINNYQYYVDANLDQFSQLTDICIDGYTKKPVQYRDTMFQFMVNGETIDVAEIEKYFLDNKDTSINSIISNDGVIIEVSYSKQIKTFNVEQEYYKYPELVTAKNQFNSEENKLNKAREAGQVSYSAANYHSAYRQYLLQLNRALDIYREEHGLVE